MTTQGVLKATEGLTSWVLPGRVDKAERTVPRVMWQVQETGCGCKERPGIGGRGGGSHCTDKLSASQNLS